MLAEDNGSNSCISGKQGTWKRKHNFNQWGQFRHNQPSHLRAKLYYSFSSSMGLTSHPNNSSIFKQFITIFRPNQLSLKASPNQGTKAEFDLPRAAKGEVLYCIVFITFICHLTSLRTVTLGCLQLKS